MKAIYKNKIADVWKISREAEQPDWVKEAFAKNYLYWLDDHLRILMAGLNPSTVENLKIGTVGTIGGGFAGYGMYVLGYIGDYLDISNHRVVSQKIFEKEYRILESL
ncbi:hypothetical protein HMPREF2887_04970 [Streptococcus sp. HMSC071H03]|uniref:Role in replication n=2 Tax=Streptococcus anginosus TaxID=1328 RepID=A0AAP6BMU9_STRAP|nr:MULTISPECIES: hypothetical protein [Streptococcus]ALL02646.1 hypothetical protein SanJ4211_0559 [Streptococcus anginosus]MDU6600993.1 hypothetical protein [Streptococcus anginosus]MDX5039600.1 hypothetical protein [Streptococcus anginosus]OFR41760.1 hypothetical protein HMPREF2887_04970 [Streptococcus sp. HMSC071H03]